MKRILVTLLLIALSLSISALANAVLIDMQDGTIYDTDLKLTWLKDANMGGIKIGMMLGLGRTAWSLRVLTTGVFP